MLHKLKWLRIQTDEFTSCEVFSQMTVIHIMFIIISLNEATEEKETNFYAFIE